MIRLSLLFFLIVTKLGVFAQEVSPSEFYFPRSLISVNASLQRMDLFTGVAYQQNLKKIDIGGSLALGSRSTFGAQQVFPQLGSYITIPFLKHCNRKGAIALGPMLSFHASFFDMGDNISQYDITAGYSLYGGKNKGRLQFIHQAGIGPFAEFFRSQTHGFVKSYHWNYHFKIGLAYAIY